MRLDYSARWDKLRRAAAGPLLEPPPGSGDRATPDAGDEHSAPGRQSPGVPAGSRDEWNSHSRDVTAIALRPNSSDRAALDAIRPTARSLDAISAISSRPTYTAARRPAVIASSS